MNPDTVELLFYLGALGWFVFGVCELVRRIKARKQRDRF